MTFTREKVLAAFRTDYENNWGPITQRTTRFWVMYGMLCSALDKAEKEKN